MVYVGAAGGIKVAVVHGQGSGADSVDHLVLLVFRGRRRILEQGGLAEEYGQPDLAAGAAALARLGRCGVQRRVQNGFIPPVH